MEFFFQAIHQQAVDRTNGTIPDLESYIALRRDTSGCKTSWVLIEYAYNLCIPDDVMDHPVLRALGEAANDLVTWSNVSARLLPHEIFEHVFRTSFRMTLNSPRDMRTT